MTLVSSANMGSDTGICSQGRVIYIVYDGQQRT